MNMNKIKILSISLGLLLVCFSCNKWLDLYPENSQTSDQYWQTKEDVESVVAAGYVKLQKSIDYLFVWGEIRGNGIDIKSSTVDDNIKAAKKLREMDILPTNLYTKWDKMYQIINMANSVIKYAPYVLERDPSFTQAEMNSFLSEAYFQRSLAYFYLVRTFRDVPLILFPYVNDDQQYEIAKSTEAEILDRIVSDLETALPSAKLYFPETDYTNPVKTKGRATKWAVYSLLADIELWRENYDKCIEYCDEVLNSGRIGLIRSDFWFTNFYPGNSNESIFEIQYDYDLSQTNDMTKWFNTDNKYMISDNAFTLFILSEPLGDVRGNGSSYLYPSGKIWKHVGIQVDKAGGYTRSSTENDNHFIIYRLADIYLMKAEALTMKGEYAKSAELIADVRSRAGIVETFQAETTELGMLELILHERTREFVAEGKNWFDLLRIGKRNNYAYKDFMIRQVVLAVASNKISIVSSKLADVNSHYLPISQSEMDANPLLVQNPYYASLGN